jgi:GNAT superfamily N-acetyltransferase
MLEVKQLDTSNKAQVNEFLDLPFRLYADCPQWVPPILVDVKAMLNPKKHPFYEHSEVAFFYAQRDGEFVGRIAAIENKPFNLYHGTKKANFYLFETVNDQEVANVLFERVFEWARKRGLDHIVGPKGLSLFDGYGIQVEGFDLRQMMTMMTYNYPYYPEMMENLGFEKEVDFVSCYISPQSFRVPEKIHNVAQKVQERGSLRIKNFSSKRELRQWAGKIGKAYNNTFVNNWEYYPQTEREIKYTLDDIIMVANPRLIKLITHNDDVVGFAFGFPDVSRALQRMRGRLTPWAIADLLIEMKRANWISFNGIGVLPKFQGRGGPALMYTEMEKTLREFNYEHGELTQVAESAVQMRKELERLGGKAYKNHRVYRRDI